MTDREVAIVNLSLSNNWWKFFVSLVPLLFLLSYMMFGGKQEEAETKENQTVAEAASYSAVKTSDPWYLSLSEDPIFALYNSLTPVQKGVVWVILIVAACGFWKIFTSRDGSMAKDVAYALSIFAAIYLLIGFISSSFDGDGAGEVRSKSSSRTASSADRSSMQEKRQVLPPKKLVLPPYGKVTLTKKRHCYVDNRFDDVLRNTHRYEDGKKLVFTSNLNETFKLVVWFYNTDLGCEAGARKLYAEGKFL